MGMVGKWAIHPSQVKLANEVFTPAVAGPRILAAMDVAKARVGAGPRGGWSIAAMAEAQAKGQGAVTYKGRLNDIARGRKAQVIVRMGSLIAG